MVCLVNWDAIAVQAAAGEGFPRNLEGSRKQRFFLAHHGLDFVFHAGDFRFQLFLHPLEFHQFLDLAFHVRVAHCVCLLLIGNLLFLFTVIIIHDRVSFVNSEMKFYSELFHADLTIAT